MQQVCQWILKKQLWAHFSPKFKIFSLFFVERTSYFHYYQPLSAWHFRYRIATAPPLPCCYCQIVTSWLVRRLSNCIQINISISVFFPFVTENTEKCKIIHTIMQIVWWVMIDNDRCSHLVWWQETKVVLCHHDNNVDWCRRRPGTGIWSKSGD